MTTEPTIMMGPHTKLGEALETDRGRAILSRFFDANVRNNLPFDALLELPTSVALSIAGVVPQHRDALVRELGGIPRADRPHPGSSTPTSAYDQNGASLARVRLPDHAETRRMVEIVLEGPSHGNPFTDVDVRAEFISESGRSIRTGGFYDGGGVYVLRFLPEAAGRWTFRTTSNAHALDGLEGQIEVDEGSAPGIVRVADRTGFAYDDGQSFVPIGTTIYAWTHQTEQLQEETLKTLEASPFTKVRMCIFPKSYDHNADDPALFPFEASGTAFDHDRFVPAFFRHIEQRIQDLDTRGIQADLILFHPYDRWGFADMGPAVDERYLRYAVRRFAAFPNVWWSMANEYDLVTSKDIPEWNRLAEVVREEDPYGHLLSIHNGIYPFDYSADWTTHASLQRCESIRSTEIAPDLIRRWGKPVVFDEMGYEGDLEAEWGNVPAFEVVRQFWEAAVAGAYVTHGETFWREDGVIFWARGGSLIGDSPARIAFLSRIIAESPSGRLDMVRTGLLGRAGGIAGLYEVMYLGLAQPRVTTVVVPEGRRAEVDIIDTWEMTIDTVPGEHEGRAQIPLPAKPYLAVRMRVTA